MRHGILMGDNALQNEFSVAKLRTVIFALSYQMHSWFQKDFIKRFLSSCKEAKTYIIVQNAPCLSANNASKQQVTEKKMGYREFSYSQEEGEVLCTARTVCLDIFLRVI